MKRDVNFGLLILIIASVLLFSGISVYYQTTFKDISLEYKEKLIQLNDVSNELEQQKTKLNETFSLRLKAETDRKVLDSRYNDLSGDNEQLERDNSNLASEVSTVKNNLAEKKAMLSATESKLTSTQSQLNAANQQVTSLKGKNARLASDLDDVCDFLTDNELSHNDC